MQNRYIERKWAQLALSVLMARDNEPIEHEWEDDLKMMASYFFDISKVIKKDRNAIKWTNRPQIDRLIANPEFAIYMNEHTQKEAAEFFGCSIASICYALKELKNPTVREKQGKWKFKEMYETQEEFRNDIQNFTLQYCSEKYNIPRRCLANYIQQFEIKRGGKTGKHKK